MASPLSNLPAEVIEAVAAKLSPTSLFALRLSCREINQKTLHHFGQACFATLETDLSHDDVQRLQCISKNEQFRHSVQTLVFRADNDDRFGGGFYWHRLEEGCVDTRLSSAVQLFQDILKGMTKCTSFSIQTLGGMEHDPHMAYLLPSLLPSDVICIILSIIAETDLPVKSFFVNYRSLGLGSESARRLQMSFCQRPKLRNAWKNVEELELEHMLTSHTFEWAKNLVLHPTSLKKLRLHFDFDHTTSFIGDLLAFPHVFQGLQEFKLGSAHVTGNMLSSILMETSKSLRVLSFWHLTLHEGTWVAVLEQLRDNIPLLESVSINWPTECNNEDRTHVQFPSLDDNGVIPGSNGRKFELRHKKWKGQRRVWGASYHGPLGMDKALDILAKSAVHA